MEQKINPLQQKIFVKPYSCQLSDQASRSSSQWVLGP